MAAGAVTILLALAGCQDATHPHERPPRPEPRLPPQSVQWQQPEADLERARTASDGERSPDAAHGASDEPADAARAADAADRDPAVLARGRERFLVHCAVCHGRDAAGDGPVVAYGFAAPPALRGSAAGLSRVEIEAIIDRGRERMPPYGGRMTRTDRHAIASYVASLAAAAPGPAQPERTAP